MIKTDSRLIERTRPLTSCPTVMRGSESDRGRRPYYFCSAFKLSEHRGEVGGLIGPLAGECRTPAVDYCSCGGV